MTRPTPLVFGDKRLPQRFWEKVRREPSGCWWWIGYRNGRGYGHYYEEGRMLKAHRVAYGALFAPIPDGLTLDHFCRNRSCVNPSHMEPASLRDNILRGASWSAENARKTHCVNGHAFTPENTYVRVNGERGWRTCRRCHREQELAAKRAGRRK